MILSPLLTSLVSPGLVLNVLGALFQGERLYFRSSIFFFLSLILAFMALPFAFMISMTQKEHPVLGTMFMFFHPKCSQFLSFLTWWLAFALISEEADVGDAWKACPESGWLLWFDEAISLILQSIRLQSISGPRICETEKVKPREDAPKLNPGSECPAMRVCGHQDKWELWGTERDAYLDNVEFPMEEEDLAVWNGVLVSICCHLDTTQGHFGGKRVQTE